jgi:hypothetical protein
MHIAWSEFTPYGSLIGGLLIGIAATLLLLALGRIAGVAGIVAGLFAGFLPGQSQEWHWRIAFVIGLIAAPFVYAQFATLPPIQIDGTWVQIITAGLLVGVGTRLGSGCTSGHGVCGLARLSLRSLVATLCFMTTGFFTVYIIRHFA